MAMASDSLKFSVDSQLMGELGEKLVTKNYVALSELIKNSYDAEATSAIVKLIKASHGGPAGNDAEIHIIDNGSGLSLEDVQNYWMRIATPHKVNSPVSPVYGRHRTGSKGVGRFACQKISRRLQLVTTAKVGKDRFETTEVKFEWHKFVPGTDLTVIPCTYKVTHSETGTPGFILKLQDLRDRWMDRDFNMLQRQIALIVVQQETRREGFKEDPGFSIVLEESEFKKTDQPLLEQIMAAGWGTLSGKVLQKGKVSLSLDAKLIGTRDYELTKAYPSLADVRFEISWLVQETEYLRNPKLIPKYLGRLLQEYGGVRVYGDGFRVYPYGDPEDDWLGIDRDVARRKGSIDDPILQKLAKKLSLDDPRPMLSYPRHRSLFGKVLISTGTKSPFVVKMDREGLVDNEAYQALIEVLRQSIDWMTLYFSAFKQRLSKTKAEGAVREFRKAIKAPETEEKEKLVNKALELLASTAVQAAVIATDNQNKKAVGDARKLVQSRLVEADEELSVLRAVASTGPLMFVFAHEVKGVMGALDTHALRLETLLPALKGKQKQEIKDLAHSFRDTSNRFDQLSKLFGIFTASQRREKKRFYLRKVVETIKEGFTFAIDTFEVDLSISGINNDLKTPLIKEAELYSVLVNLLSNALKAVIAAKGERISIKAGRNTKFYIRVDDDGVGLNKKYWQEVFEPLTVDPENRIYPKLLGRLGDKDLVALGRGSGLGLSIVKGIVESNGGSVSFIEASKGWKTSVLVELP